jgi:hypothetical protein
MDIVNKPRSLLAVLTLWLAVASGLAQSVKTDFDKSMDFSHFRTYAWRQSPIFEKQPALEEQYSVALQLVTSAVNQGLRTKGLARTDDSPDFYVTVFVVAKGMQDIRTFSTGGWYGWSGYWDPGWTEVTVTNYTEGTLVLDFVNAATKQLAWRAYCKDDIRDLKTRHKNIEKAVEKALKKFPPKQKNS